MKPIVKICIALSAILFLLGIAGLGVGAAMGVTPSDLLYSGHFPGRFSLRSGPGLQITEELPNSLEELPDSISPDLPAPSGDNPSGSEEYYEFRDIQSFDLELGLCELRILSHEEDHIAVCADNTQDYFQCRQDGQTLVLTDSRPSSTKTDSMDDALRLDLYLPGQDYRELSVDLGTGKLTLEDLSADHVDIEHGIGTLTIGTLSCRELDVEAGIVEFRADSLLSSVEADIEVGTGTVTVARFDGKDLTLECGTGNAEVTAAGSEGDYNYTLNAALGTICLDHHLQDCSAFGNHHGSHHGEDDDCLNIHHGADRNIHIQCALGNAELNFMEE